MANVLEFDCDFAFEVERGTRDGFNNIVIPDGEIEISTEIYKRKSVDIPDIILTTIIAYPLTKSLDYIIKYIIEWIREHIKKGHRLLDKNMKPIPTKKIEEIVKELIKMKKLNNKK